MGRWSATSTVCHMHGTMSVQTASIRQLTVTWSQYVWLAVASQAVRRSRAHGTWQTGLVDERHNCASRPQDDYHISAVMTTTAQSRHQTMSTRHQCTERHILSVKAVSPVTDHIQPLTKAHIAHSIGLPASQVLKCTAYHCQITLKCKNKLSAQ